MNDGEAEDEGDGEGEDEEEEEEEQEGRRRYDLRNHADVCRLSMEEGKQRPRSPRRLLHQGIGTRVNRDVRKGGSRIHKHHRMTRAQDSDDSLLVDELDQGPAILALKEGDLARLAIGHWSILYIPQFNLWWENAHEQLRAVLLTLLEEFPSDLPILLLGTSKDLCVEIDGHAVPVFPQRFMILYDKRFSTFHYPVTDEDAPNYRTIVHNPMDMATLLQCVDSGQYITCSAFLQDIDLIMTNAKLYNGDDYNGARIVSRAYELQDAVHGMLLRMDPALVACCDMIAAQGGPVYIPDDMAGSILPPTPVVQLGAVTRASARLHNVQPEVNLDQSYEALKRQKKNVDVSRAASTAEDKSRQQNALQAKPSEELGANDMNPERPESSFADDNRPETSGEASAHTEGSGSQEATMLDAEITSHVEYVKRLFDEHTENCGIPQLERLYTRLMKGVFETKDKGLEDEPKYSILKFLVKFAEDEENF